MRLRLCLDFSATALHRLRWETLRSVQLCAQSALRALVMVDRAMTEHVPPALLEDSRARFDAMDFSVFADSLGYPHFGESAKDPLLILADLPVPVYLSTSYHSTQSN